MPPIHVVGAAIRDGQKCLVAQRGSDRRLAGKWEFPGGKVEPGEAPTAALAREISEELGLQIEVGRLLGTGSATVGDGSITLDVYAATIIGGTLVVREHAHVVWASAAELRSFDWAEADVPSLSAVESWLRSPPGTPENGA